jgi:hypothetical protein
MIVSFLYWVFVSPLILNRLERSNRHAFLCLVRVLISVVSESESWVVEGSFFHNCKEFCVVEGFNRHLGDIIEEIVVIYGSHFLSFEIDDVDVSLRNVHNDDLAFVEHAEEVNNVGVLMLEEYFAICIDVDDALIGSGINDLTENEGIVEGSGEAEYLRDSVFEFKLVLLFEKHISIFK